MEGFEEKAKEEAARQVQHWLKGRLENLLMKRNLAEGMLKLLVTGNEDENSEARELKSEL